MPKLFHLGSFWCRMRNFPYPNQVRASKPIKIVSFCELNVYFNESKITRCIYQTLNAHRSDWNISRVVIYISDLCVPGQSQAMEGLSSSSLAGHRALGWAIWAMDRHARQSAVRSELSNHFASRGLFKVTN